MWYRQMKRVSIVGKEGGPIDENCQCSGGGLAEKNCQRDVIFALRIREETSLSLEKEVYLYMILMVE